MYHLCAVSRARTPRGSHQPWHNGCTEHRDRAPGGPAPGRAPARPIHHTYPYARTPVGLGQGAGGARPWDPGSR
jgi:hypothetical protein